MGTMRGEGGPLKLQSSPRLRPAIVALVLMRWRGLQIGSEAAEWEGIGPQ